MIAGLVLLLLATPLHAAEKMSGSDLEERLRVHVYRLAHEIGERNSLRYRSLQKARDYVAETFGDAGYPVRLQEYRAWDLGFENVIATLPGSGGPEAGTLVVGAHYDSAPGTPGADDNASGVAALLEIARVLKREPLRKTLLFAAFSTEEPPYFGTELMGSRFFAAEVARGPSRVEGMVCLETIGYYRKEKGSQKYPFFLSLFYPPQADFIGLVGNFRSHALLARVRDGLRLHSPVPMVHATLPSFVTGVDWSDHRSFWEEGIPAVMLTDTALFRNPNYHEATDTYESLDYATEAALVAGLAETVKDLAR